FGQLNLSAEENAQVVASTEEVKAAVIEDLQEKGVQPLQERGVVGRIYPLPILISGLEVEFPNLFKIAGLHGRGQLYIAAVKFMNPVDMSTHYKFSMLRIIGGGITATISKEKTNI